MILNELDGCNLVGRVEFVGDVPAEWTELSAFLDGGVEKTDGEKHGFPVRKAGEVESLLAVAGVGSFETGLHSLVRFVGDPDAEGGVDFFRVQRNKRLEELGHKLET